MSAASRARVDECSSQRDDVWYTPPCSPIGDHYPPTSPEYEPLYSPQRSPVYAPTSPEYGSRSPVYVPASPEYDSRSPEYVPASPNYSDSNRYSHLIDALGRAETGGNVLARHLDDRRIERQIGETGEYPASSFVMLGEAKMRADWWCCFDMLARLANRRV